MNRELPILMNGAMVRAVLDGRKTVTRRLVKPQPSAAHEWKGWILSGTRASDAGKAAWGVPIFPHIYRDPIEVRPPYEVEDRLYVRETAMREPHPSEIGLRREDIPGTWDMACEAAGTVHYLADLAGNDPSWVSDGRRWTPSIHMPKWAARIWLEVTAVRVERLQDITYEQALAEGAIDGAEAVDRFDPPGEESGDDVARRLAWPQRDFALLWDGLAKPGTRWADNPWVWCISFRRVA